MRIKLLHTIIDECQYRGAWLKSEALNEALTGLKSTRKGDIEFFTFLT
jgi:hypothetical protein